jgi:hypothetical protein
MTRSRFDAQLGAEGALLIGEPNEVIEKVLHHSEALGGLTRVTFQMNASSLPHAKLMQAIEMLGTRVAPVVRKEFTFPAANARAS